MVRLLERGFLKFKDRSNVDGTSSAPKMAHQFVLDGFHQQQTSRALKSI